MATGGSKISEVEETMRRLEEPPGMWGGVGKGSIENDYNPAGGQPFEPPKRGKGEKKHEG